MKISYHLLRTNSDHPDFQRLVIELDKDLAVRNGAANDFFVPYNNSSLLSQVVVAYEGEQPVGCGALKEYETGITEIKRMFVPLNKRGKGVATAVLNELQVWAKELGYIKCILETGDKMPEAIALYQKNKFHKIPNYGQYAQVESSVCMEKGL